MEWKEEGQNKVLSKLNKVQSWCSSCSSVFCQRNAISMYKQKSIWRITGKNLKIFFFFLADSCSWQEMTLVHNSTIFRIISFCNMPQNYYTQTSWKHFIHWPAMKPAAVNESCCSNTRRLFIALFSTDSQSKELWNRYVKLERRKTDEIRFVRHFQDANLHKYSILVCGFFFFFFSLVAWSVR